MFERKVLVKILTKLVLLYLVLFGGLVFGWPPLQLLLEEDNVLSANCSDESDGVCTSRDTELKLIYTMGCAAFSVGNFVAGHVVDTYGPAAASVVHSIFIPLAMFCFGFAPAESYSLLMLGGICLGFGGSFVLLNAFPLAFLAEDGDSAFIMTAANCLFDASASIFLPVYILYHDASLTRQEVFGGLGAISLVLSAAIVTLWTAISARSDDEGYALPDEQTMASPIKRVLAEATDGAAPVTVAVADEGQDDSVVCETHGLENCITPPILEMQDGIGMAEKQELQWTNHLSGTKFWFITSLYTIQSIRNVMYMVLVLSVLKVLGDEKHDFLFTQLYAAGLCSSFLYINLVHYSYDQFGMKKCFGLVNALGYVWGVIAVIPVLELQVVGFVAFYIYRAYLYSLVGMYMASVFGPGLSGRLYGAANLMCGAALLIQYPAYYMIATYAHSNYNYLSAASLALNVVCSLIVELAYPLLEEVGNGGALEQQSVEMITTGSKVDIAVGV